MNTKLTVDVNLTLNDLGYLLTTLTDSGRDGEFADVPVTVPLTLRQVRIAYAAVGSKDAHLGLMPEVADELLRSGKELRASIEAVLPLLFAPTRPLAYNDDATVKVFAYLHADKPVRKCDKCPKLIRWGKTAGRLLKGGKRGDPSPCPFSLMPDGTPELEVDSDGDLVLVSHFTDCPAAGSFGKQAKHAKVETEQEDSEYQQALAED